MCSGHQKGALHCFFVLKMPAALSENQRIEIIASSREGLSRSEIAARVGCHPRSVARIVSKFELEGTLKPSSSTGRKRIISPAQERHIVINAKRDRRLTRQELINELNLDVCKATITNVLKRNDLRFRISRKKPLISMRNRQARLKFARKYIEFDTSFWRKVLFTDESRFASQNDRGHSYVICYSNEALSTVCLNATWKSRITMTAWGSMGYNGVGTLVQIIGNMDAELFLSVLDIGLQESVAKNNLPSNWILQQDNDPKHTSSLARDYYARHHLKLLKWPSQSPDLNPIEHLWADIKRRLRGKRFSSKKDFEEKVTETWYQTDVELVKKLIDSMPRRLLAVIAAKSGHTRY